MVDNDLVEAGSGGECFLQAAEREVPVADAAGLACRCRLVALRGSPAPKLDPRAPFLIRHQTISGATWSVVIIRILFVVFILVIIFMFRSADRDSLRSTPTLKSTIHDQGDDALARPCTSPFPY